eukprot:712850-Pleurochrysis_carterae.AAC.1
MAVDVRRQGSFLGTLMRVDQLVARRLDELVRQLPPSNPLQVLSPQHMPKATMTPRTVERQEAYKDGAVKDTQDSRGFQKQGDVILVECSTTSVSSAVGGADAQAMYKLNITAAGRQDWDSVFSCGENSVLTGFCFHAAAA